MIYIYALIDPFTFKIRYIGKTVRLKERLQNQCNERIHTYRSHWIQSIISMGRRPIQRVIRSLPNGSDWQKEEIKWISIARKYNWPLVNCTDGGDGVTNISGEGKERMLKTWRGRRHKPESLVKLSKASKGRIKPERAKDIVSEKMKGRQITWKDKLQEAKRKFTDDQLIDVIHDFNAGMKTMQIAKKYNIHRTTATKIKMGTYKTFKQKTYNYVKPRRFHSKNNQL